VVVQVDLSERPLKTLTLHRMLHVLIKEEDKVALKIQKSLKEVIMQQLCDRMQQ